VSGVAEAARVGGSEQSVRRGEPGPDGGVGRDEPGPHRVLGSLEHGEGGADDEHADAEHDVPRIDRRVDPEQPRVARTPAPDAGRVDEVQIGGDDR
jgi:hypothetical protein